MNKVFYIFGTAPSINNITQQEWLYLKNEETLGIGLFPFSHKQLKYYHCWEGGVEELLIEILLNDNFTSSTLLLGTERTESIKNAFNYGFNVIPVIKGRGAYPFKGKSWFMDEDIPCCSFKDCRAHNFKQGLFRFRGSLSAAINSALILGATEIRLVGVDLTSEDDFYFNINRWHNQKYVNQINQIKQMHIDDVNLRKKNQPNLTKQLETVNITNIPYTYKKFGSNVLRPIEDVISWMDVEIRNEGFNGIFVCNKDSLLYKHNKIEYKSIMGDNYEILQSLRDV